MKYILVLFYFISFTLFAKNTEVTLIIPDKKGPVFWQFVSDVSKSAAKNLNINLEIIYTNSHRFALKNTIDEILKRKVKPEYIIFRPFLGNTAQVFNQLERHKVKFVTLEQAFDGRIKQIIGTPQHKYKYWLGEVIYDNKAGGELLLNTLIHEQRKRSSDEMIYVTAIGGDFDKVSKDREDIFNRLSQLENPKKIFVNQVIPMYWNPNNLEQRFPALQKRYPKTNIYWCAGDQLALKVLALANHPSKLIIGGFDWLPIMLKKIKSQEVTASVGGHFLMVAKALIKIVDYESGHNQFLTSPQLHKLEIITIDNVDSHISFFEDKGWNQIDFNLYLHANNKNTPILTTQHLINQIIPQ